MEKIDEIEKKTIEWVDRLTFFDRSGKVFIPKKIRDDFENCAFLPEEKEDGIFLKKVIIR